MSANASASSQSVHPPVVLVTGGAGFLGASLSEALLRSGARVLAVDKLGSRENIAAFEHHPKYQFFDCDITKGLPDSLTGLAISHIIHVPDTLGDTGEKEYVLSLLQWSLGTKNVLDLAVKSQARVVLRSAIEIYQGMASSTSLENYFGATFEEERQYAKLEAMRYAEMLAETYVRLYGLDVRVARLSEVYGPRMSLTGNSLLARLIAKTLQGESLVVEVEGSKEVVLTYVSDAVFGILRLLFADNETFKKSIYQFANTEKVSVLSIAYTLGSFLPAEKEVTFSSRDHDTLDRPATLSVDRAKRDLGWEPLVNVTEGLQRTVEWFKSDEKKAGPTEGDPDDAVKQEDKPEKLSALDKAKGGNLIEKIEGKTGAKKKKHWWGRLPVVGIAVGLFAIFGQPAAYAMGNGVVAGWRLNQGIDQSKQLQFGEAADNFYLAENHFDQVISDSQRLESRLNLLGFHSVVLRQIISAAEGAREASGSLAIAAHSTAGVADIYQGKSKASGASLAATLGHWQAGLAKADTGWRKAQSYWLGGAGDSRVAGVMTTSAGDAPQSWLERLLQRGVMVAGQMATLFESGQEVAGLTPQLLGVKKQGTYLIVLENSEELRPTGGLLEGYLLLRVNQGKVSSWRSGSLAELDQSRGTMVAPEPFVQQFGEQTIGVADANWSPDGPTAAQQISQQFLLATGVPVDGVDLITLGGLKEILQQTGGLPVTGYGETATSQNLSLLIQRYSNQVSQTGSGRSFTEALLRSLARWVEQRGLGGTIKLSQAVANGLNDQEIMVYATDPAIETYARNQGWSGQVPMVEGDYVRVVEANLGGNLANFFVQRQTGYTVTVAADGSAQGELKVTWVYGQSQAVWPGGDYLAYVRVYVPKGTVLTSVEGMKEDGRQTEDELDKTVFGGWVQVPVGGKETMTLRYNLPPGIGLGANSAYQLTWQKQPGIENEPVQVTVDLPSGWKVIDQSAAGTVQGNGVKWQFNGTSDQQMQVMVGLRG